MEVGHDKGAGAERDLGEESHVAGRVQDVPRKHNRCRRLARPRQVGNVVVALHGDQFAHVRKALLPRSIKVALARRRSGGRVLVTVRAAANAHLARLGSREEGVANALGRAVVVLDLARVHNSRVPNTGNQALARREASHAFAACARRDAAGNRLVPRRVAKGVFGAVKRYAIMSASQYKSYALVRVHVLEMAPHWPLESHSREGEPE